MGSGIIHHYIVELIGEAHLFKTFYILNVILGIISYKLGFARELPLLKSIIVYIMLFIGMFVITIFNLFGLPITESLIVISLVLAIYRFRMYRERKARGEEQ
ncbi:MAG TPA: YlaH-like family protein [Pseudogracilibacillus sp.]|nr:YlaH-like family protein [Pseudogracilibacillus sp.]